jgi:hypothetical protein
VYEKLTKTDQPNVRPAHLIIKEAINTWIHSLEDHNRPLPAKAHARVVTPFGNNKLMIEMNSSKMVNWMRANISRILGQILNSPVKLLTCSYTVVARFMPIAFDRTPASLRAIEDDMAFPHKSILDSSWVKDPSKHTKLQKCANLKLYCLTPKTANTLINGPTYILGSRLSIQKDIRSPGVCNKCQKYSHIVKSCMETNDTFRTCGSCGSCGKDHCTSLCQEKVLHKCTPCRSTDHTTSYTSCPIYCQQEQAMKDKDPETVLPYHLTHESWTCRL